MAQPRLLFFDARLVFFVALFAFHIRWWTFTLLVTAICGLAAANQLNYSIEALIRLLRSKLVGAARPALPYTRLRPMIDYSAEAAKKPSRAPNG
ncbi:IcmT/TraK family protein [Labrenzia sp. DG1229]|uniref:IcmT/TraK family protein n=1 Tax=Labrenzia sp. DG1229 TaxID=681847 RepID=UPI00068E65A9|nr:IcmT/TraK family protein [Labrenzia sp. DG1229]